jgi:indolepyruvate ferredoxin oxidoreductase
MVVVNDYWALSKIRADRTEVVINDYQAMPGPFTRMPDMQFPAQGIVDAIRTAMGGREPLQIAATEIATALIGDAIATNLFMLGVAWQRGLVPISFDALVRAIELNGAAVEMNKTAFAWGRLAAIDPQAVLEAAGLAEAPAQAQAATLDDEVLSTTLDETIERRVKFLTDYQDRAYAGRYVALVDKVRQAEARKASGSTALTEAVARYYFKLMAYKDEYEVARLYTSGEFMQRIQKQFDGDYKIHFNLAPPMLSKRDANGHLVKQEFGPWIFTAFKLIKRLKFLRGGAFDVFGKTGERRMERQLIVDYARTMEELLGTLDDDNVDLATQIAAVPEHIRGYGHVKEAHFAKAKAHEAELLAAWRAPAKTISAS